MNPAIKCVQGNVIELWPRRTLDERLDRLDQQIARDEALRRALARQDRDWERLHRSLMVALWTLVGGLVVYEAVSAMLMAVP